MGEFVIRRRFALALSADGRKTNDADNGRSLSVPRMNPPKNKWVKITIIVISLTLIAAIIYFFPVYRMIQVGGSSYFSGSEIARLAYIGSPKDRAQAQSILRQADAAFQDCKHTRAENEKLYGMLSRYATHTDNWNDVSFVNHSLKLWSASFDDTKGILWVYYSSEAINTNGEVVTSSKNVPAIWTAEKDSAGQWRVVSIKEHP